MRNPPSQGCVTSAIAPDAEWKPAIGSATRPSLLCRSDVLLGRAGKPARWIGATALPLGPVLYPIKLRCTCTLPSASAPMRRSRPQNRQGQMPHTGWFWGRRARPSTVCRRRREDHARSSTSILPVAGGSIPSLPRRVYRHQAGGRVFRLTRVPALVASAIADAGWPGR